MVHPTGHIGQDENDFSYYDHTISTSFKFDPITMEGEIISSDAMDVPTNDLREKLIPLCDAYSKKAYRKPKCKFNVHCEGDKI